MGDGNQSEYLKSKLTEIYFPIYDLPRFKNDVHNHLGFNAKQRNARYRSVASRCWCIFIRWLFVAAGALTWPTYGTAGIWLCHRGNWPSSISLGHLGGMTEQMLVGVCTGKGTEAGNGPAKTSCKETGRRMKGLNRRDNMESVVSQHEGLIKKMEKNERHWDNSSK